MTVPAATSDSHSAPLPESSIALVPLPPAPIAPVPTVPSLPTPELAQRRPFPSTRMLWLLLIALTALAAYLRFWRLGYQPYWTDEAYTIERINGAYTYMLGQITNQGFPPGWYSLLRYWRIFLENFLPRADTFAPEYMRALPAFFGTLTVPAMYFLARQFTDRKGALLVMLLAAVNPYFIYYAREIKMYTGLWFFATLNMALFFHWQTTRRHAVWFPLFVLSGVVMTTMNSIAWVIPALQFIYILTRPKPKGWDAPLWLIGVGLMTLIPIFWYLEYLQPARWSGRVTGDTSQGMEWITMYTDMSWQTLTSLPTVHILGYLWPVYPPNARLDDWFLLGGNDFITHLASRSWPWMVKAQIYAAIGLFAVMLLGLIPWRGIRRSPERDNSSTRGRWWWIALWILIPAGGLALTWIPTRADLQQEIATLQVEQRRAVQNLDAARRQYETMPEDDPGKAALVATIATREKAVQQLDDKITAADDLYETDWFQRVWGSLDPKKLWEPRWLGIIIPAWLLWLGAALRRLPTIPIRALLITATVGACTYSSLSNHLIYRNPPFNRTTEILEKFVDPKNRSTTAVAMPHVKFPFPAATITYYVSRHLAPPPFSSPTINAMARDNEDMPYTSSGSSSGSRYAWIWPINMTEPNRIISWLRSSVVNNATLKTLVLTDRYGDLTNPKEALSDEAVGRLLGPRWKLVYSESYNWHYEWRYYIFHTWRTRVWQVTP